MSKKGKRTLIILVVVVIGIFMVSRGRKSKAKYVIKEVTPVYGSIYSFISTTGTVQPQNRLEIKPQINGRIEEILVNEGQKVKVGQTLAWMSSTERAALLDAARSKGEEELKRWEDVYKPTPLIAPINGEVIVRAVEPGQTVTSSDAVIVLSDRLIVKAQVDETDIGKVRIKQAAIISLDAYPHIKVKAEVDHISYESTIVNNVTIYEVDVLPEKIPDVFRSGMSANVDIIQEAKENVLTIPLEAVAEDETGAFVFVQKNGNAKTVKQKVKLGMSDDKNVEVISGIAPQDKIIIQVKSYTFLKEPNQSGSPFLPFGRRRR
ncbi:MAG: efflux RND transporter periplasmic adaptor subunit [Candidatus Omnitrophota bacterium]|nr:MAG: efflux RND transporter periplasmic adaptor subunit [Candidatus Omnitrophota bacterium]